MMAQGQDPLADRKVNVSIELARTQMSLDEALALGESSVVELDRLAGEPVMVRLNGKLYAHGEVVALEGNYGVRLTEVFGHD
jgi:flagellar motor switch protein FliN/FliY